MVFVAFLLLTASTLAIHGKVVSPDGPIIPRGCEGPLCDQESDDYPQKEIDNHFASHPAQVARLKREVGLEGTACAETAAEMPNLSKEGCNCETIIKCSKPYPDMDNESISGPIKDSKFFDQEIRQVECAAQGPNTSCFNPLVEDSFKTKCQQKRISTKVVLYDKLKKEPVEIKGFIDVDCACVR